MQQRDYYEILGVEENSLQEEIDERYERLSQFLSSDSVEEDLVPWADRQSALVEEAYAVLSDSSRRRTYDLRRREPVVDPSPQAQPQAQTQASPGPTAWRAPARRREVVSQGPAWWLRGPVPMAFGGLLLGVALLPLMAAGTGNWDKVTNIFDGSSDSGSTSANGDEPLIDGAVVAQLEERVRLYPSDGEALYSLGLIYYDAADWANVLYWMSRYTEVEPTDVLAYNVVALANLYLGRNEEALRTWEMAIELEPDSPVLHYSVGFYYGTLEDWAQAREEFQSVVELAPDTDFAHLVQPAQDQVDTINAILAGATPGSETPEP